MKALVLCLDISESMAYGEPSKLSQAINAANKALQSLGRDVLTALVTFDATAEVWLDLQPSNHEKIADALVQIEPRGVTCIAAGLVESGNFTKKSGHEGEVLLLTDGRANLSQNRTGGFEGSLMLEEELVGISRLASQRDITIHTVAVGEDAFTHTLSTLSGNAKGGYWLAEDFQGFTPQPPKSLSILETRELQFYGVPVELPSAQPTWTKESQLMHVAVVSQGLYEAYRINHRAFIVNPSNGREARTALISVESDLLADYRQRRPKTAEKVRTEVAILIDRSYRDYLAMAEEAEVKLIIF